VLSDGFNQLINSSHPVVAGALQKIKDGYENFINSMIETLSLQIEMLQTENN
jgi:hypothetical protein